MMTPSLDPSTWTPAQRTRMRVEAAKLRRFRERARLDAAAAFDANAIDPSTQPCICYVGQGALRGKTPCMRCGMRADAASGWPKADCRPCNEAEQPRTDASERFDGAGRPRLLEALDDALYRGELDDESIAKIRGSLDKFAETRAAPQTSTTEPKPVATAEQAPANHDQATAVDPATKDKKMGEPCACDDGKLDARTIDTREHRGNIVDDARARHDARVRDAWMTTSPITPGPKRTLDSSEARETGFENPHAGYESPYATGYDNPWAGYDNPYSGDTPEALASALRNDGRRPR
jgi:hypothetical protein